MEHANRAEAERCIDMARDLLHTDKARANKLLDKAMRLDTSALTKQKVEKIKSTMTEENEPTNSDYTHNSHYDQPRHRQPRSTSTSRNGKSATDATRSRSRSLGKHTQSEPQLGTDYTEAELETIRRIRRCKDYYEILGVTKEASDADLKKGYRKLALQFHPDKCKAPGATEAFKAIGNAYAVLSDTAKRERYDMYGGQVEETTTSHHHRHQHADYTRGFDADFTPEEIFNMFFGGGYPTGQMYRRGNRTFVYQRSAQDAQHPQESSGFGVALQLLPILLLLFLSIASQFFVGDAAFNMHRTTKYSVERKTGELNVVYYVKTDFLKQYSQYIKRIEQQVEDEYIQQLRMACYRERSQKESMAWRARTYGDSALWERAQSMPTPNCDQLQKVYA